jgi:4'-phosphopantetheinyl transferase
MGIPHRAGAADVSAPPPDGPVAHAYYCRTQSLDAHHADAALQLLSADERRRCGWLSRDTDRRDFVAAHALLRTALAEHTHVPPALLAFERDALGRPLLVWGDPHSSPPSFSLSHTSGLVACVIASAHTTSGIDVEAIDHCLDVVALAAHVCSADELSALHACPAAARPERFFGLWTLKEALVKAQGVGLRGMSQTSFEIGEQSIGPSLPPRLGDEPWSFLLADIDSTHVLAVAVARTAANTSVRVIAVDAVAAMHGALVALDERVDATDHPGETCRRSAY